MSKYWMFIINEENWEVVKNKNVIGTRHKYKYDKINIGDSIFIYIIRPLSALVGLFLVNSKFEDNKEIFGKIIFPFRLELNPIKILKKPAKFKVHINKISFIRNKAGWHRYLFGSKGIRELPEKDYYYLKSQVFS